MKRIIALEARLRNCRNVMTLGVRPNFNDYTDHEKDFIRHAEIIYYPTWLYAELLDSVRFHIQSIRQTIPEE